MIESVVSPFDQRYVYGLAPEATSINALPSCSLQGVGVVPKFWIYILGFVVTEIFPETGQPFTSYTVIA